MYNINIEEETLAVKDYKRLKRIPDNTLKRHHKAIAACSLSPGNFTFGNSRIIPFNKN